MRDICEKVSYLQGLSEGLNIADNSPQGKILSGMLEVLNEIADRITDIEEDFEDMKEYVESIDEDLCVLEEDIYDEMDFDNDYLYSEDTDYVELSCDDCGEPIYFESDVLDVDDVVEIICPKCNEVVFINDGSFDYVYEEGDGTLDFSNPSPS
ncbi:hypothetical protein SYNTR_0356 [Candidatus Syntrophocurvum alkaliphilum]|uniref:AraC family transcriptional regulator n=1 Tax=Candidatus Syntrophocurvum alkaliphilum TaxID=2293317 RepID=A0A6I6DH41_9FIRM|nr:CD1247 N-terminal domain-containing protein [Candidatus Syntrophocurvum alkaliphilum]QGT98949.1 hypothetical protein SYNTR_0356 [Candidatus Syntrophocurvum alkaliphilum]